MSLNVLTTGDGPPLLLLHGFTGTARTWSAQVEAWSAQHRVIAPDLLGHGGSEAPREPARYALERQAEDLSTLLGLLDATPAAVVGYSMGSRLALALALAHADVVSSLVLESPSAGIADPAARAARREADERLAAILDGDGLETFVDEWQSQPVLAGQAALPPDLRDRLRAERLSHDQHGLAASLRGAGQGAMSPLHDRLGTITCPTLVIAGERDPAGLERARTVAAGIPRARLEIIARAGHTPHLERPDAFTQITTDFLSARPTATAAR